MFDRRGSTCSGTNFLGAPICTGRSTGAYNFNAGARLVSCDMCCAPSSDAARRSCAHFAGKGVTDRASYERALPVVPRLTCAMHVAEIEFNQYDQSC